MNINRRHLLIAAGVAGLSGPTAQGMAHVPELVWSGTALGADSRIIISGLDEKRAAKMIMRATAEIERLENIFSLYRPRSELSRLNQEGVLENPSHDFRLLLERSLEIHASTAGAFNIAIQPVWAYLAGHFSRTQLAPRMEDLTRLLPACDPAQLSAAASRIVLGPGMALTFNGIAQGYITDVVAEIFKNEGLGDVLVSLGETRALQGKAWSIGIAGSDRTFTLRNGAIAQSSGRGTPLSHDGRWHHLIDPYSGTSANTVGAVTVRSSSATEADALSTALFVASPDVWRHIRVGFPDIEIFREGGAA